MPKTAACVSLVAWPLTVRGTSRLIEPSFWLTELRPDSETALRPAPTPAAVREARFLAHARLVSEVAGAWSHDLKSPLHNIQLNLSLIAETLSPTAKPELVAGRSKYLDAVSSEVHRLARMIDSVAEQLKTPEEKPRNVDLGKLLRDLTLLFSGIGRGLKTELRLALPDVGVPIETNERALSQSLFALLLGAYRAAPWGTVTVGLILQGGRAVVSIEGAPGDAPEDDGLASKPPVHDPAALDESLAAASSIVDALGGQLIGEHGQGSVVRYRVELPLGKASP